MPSVGRDRGRSRLVAVAGQIAGGQEQLCGFGMLSDKQQPLGATALLESHFQRLHNEVGVGP